MEGRGGERREEERKNYLHMSYLFDDSFSNLTSKLQTSGHSVANTDGEYSCLSKPWKHT